MSTKGPIQIWKWLPLLLAFFVSSYIRSLLTQKVEGSLRAAFFMPALRGHYFLSQSYNHCCCCCFCFFLFLSLWLLFSFLCITPFVNVVLRLFWFFLCLLLVLLFCFMLAAIAAALVASESFLCIMRRAKFPSSSFFFLLAQDSHVDKAVEAISSLNQSNRRSCTTWSRFLCIIPTHVQMAGSGFERKTIDWSANTQLSPLSQLNHERSTAKSWVVRSYI